MYNTTRDSDICTRAARVKYRGIGQVMAAVIASLAIRMGASGADRSFESRIFATTKTATMEKELNEGAAAGFRFSKVVSGKATNEGQLIIAMVKDPVAPGKEIHKYRLLSTTRTSNMQAEIQQLADGGYSYLDHTFFESLAGGKEVVVIMELDSLKHQEPRFYYRLLAPSKASTMQKELQEAGAQGYALLGFNGGKTAGGNEIIAVLRKVK